ncbi:f821eea1-df54-4ad9-9f18-97b16720abc0 [Sclerotinia trifoliorum]|uniref:F821eea1-df54-4ad9-9f18-97b16720abc0 n=1 Tax=Sclerotinia trifoliorum TaxID=28548 RepID=A0A8H2VYR3_9HELO|nr:f821eea1-df54-4ad9-9f18-97b16720abc0 [Sclerotinia trifoliorum]
MVESKSWRERTTLKSIFRSLATMNWRYHISTLAIISQAIMASLLFNLVMFQQTISSKSLINHEIFTAVQQMLQKATPELIYRIFYALYHGVESRLLEAIYPALKSQQDLLRYRHE